jgi:hypothetical protein
MRRLLILLAALLALASLTTAGAFAKGGRGGDDIGFGYGKDVRYARALNYCAVYNKKPARLGACYSTELFSLVKGRQSATEVPKIDAYVQKTGGYLQGHCHVLMHPVGRRYAASVHLTIDKLLDYLPRTNNANCSAGFSHGLLMELAPQLGSLTPEEAVKACDGAETRYQRYSCTHGEGHAYMRLYGEQLPFALHACSLLGPENAPDCAAGAFHDYWIAVSGLDSAKKPKDPITNPRLLCQKESGGYVRGCWYRALLERPPAKPIESKRDVMKECKGLTGLQRSGCVIASVVVAADDPFTEMDICVSMRRPAAADCVRGVRVADLNESPLSEQLRLIRRCAHVWHGAQNACYRWMGTALNVVTDGKFADDGCSELMFDATKRACKDGADSYDGPLETFS